MSGGRTHIDDVNSKRRQPCKLSGSLRRAGLVIGSCIDGCLNLGIAGAIERKCLLPEVGVRCEKGDKVAAVIHEALGVSCAGSCTQPGFVRTWKLLCDLLHIQDKHDPFSQMKCRHFASSRCSRGSRSGRSISAFLFMRCCWTARMPIWPRVYSMQSEDAEGQRQQRTILR